MSATRSPHFSLPIAQWNLSQLSGGLHLNSSLRGIGVAAGDTRNFVFAGFNFVSPEYFAVFRVPLVRGRNFTPEEGRDEADVVVVSQATAHKFWPTTQAIGQTLRIQPPPS